MSSLKEDIAVLRLDLKQEFPPDEKLYALTVNMDALTRVLTACEKMEAALERVATELYPAENYQEQASDVLKEVRGE